MTDIVFACESMPMPATSDPERLGELPLWAQVVTAARAIQRCAMAMDSTGDRGCVDLNSVVEGVQRCVCLGPDSNDELERLRSVINVSGMPERGGCNAMDRAAWWLVDACGAALAASDLPVDAAVTNSVRSAVAAVSGDARVNRVQLAVLFASDVDLLGFACQESRVGRYEPIPPSVFNRLTPLHPLTLIEVRPSPEEEAR